MASSSKVMSPMLGSSLKVSESIFKGSTLIKEALLCDITFDEDAIPPPPEFNQKILTSDNASDLSFRTSKTNNTSNTSNSNYSDRMNDIKQQYRQFQNNLQNQNKLSNESSDQTSYFSASAASSMKSNQLDDMKSEEIQMEKDPFFVPPPPKKNNVFLFPGRNGSKSSVKTGLTSYYSATSDIFDEDASNKFSVRRDDMSEVAQTALSYHDPNNDAASINSFHSCLNPSKMNNVFNNLDSDQISSTGSSNFYSIGSAQLTSQSLPYHDNGAASAKATPSFASPPLMHHDSVKSSSTAFHSMNDDSQISGISDASQVTNPFLRDALASNPSEPLSSTNNGYLSPQGISPASQNVFNDTSSFASAADSFHTVKTAGKRNNDYTGPLPMAQNVFNDTSSFASATDSFHTVKTAGKRNVPQGQNFTDTSSFVSAADSFFTVKSQATETGKPDYNPFKN